MDEDISFLGDLDKRIHGNPHISTFTPNICGDPVHYLVRGYRYDINISLDEIERIVDILGKRRDIVIYPTNTNFGLSVGFALDFVEQQFPGTEEEITILTFIKEQLPEGWNFERMSEYFISSDNLRRNEYFGPNH